MNTLNSPVKVMNTTPRTLHVQVTMDVPPQILFEDIHQALRKADLFHGIQKHWDLQVRPCHFVLASPHGCHEWNSNTSGLRRATEAHCDRLLLGHLLWGNEAPDGARDRPPCETGTYRLLHEVVGGTSEYEADDSEEGIESDVHEDAEYDGALGHRIEGTGLEGVREGGPAFLVSKSIDTSPGIRGAQIIESILTTQACTGRKLPLSQGEVSAQTRRSAS